MYCKLIPKTPRKLFLSALGHRRTNFLKRTQHWLKCMEGRTVTYDCCIGEDQRKKKKIVRGSDHEDQRIT